MGLGKSLITISVIWTLLKQTPPGEKSPPLKKILICCPVTLVDNWKKEFGKWLDLNRIGVLAINGKSQSASRDKSDIKNFGKTKVYQVMIMSYEKVLTCSKELQLVSIDLLVCDEAHRLKNSSSKILGFLTNLNTPRRLLLTGTPIQNDLHEFFNIVNFVNPGIFGTMPLFQKEFLKPITRARDVNCTNKEAIVLGKKKSEELIEITKSFTLRRTKSVLDTYLPKKTDILLFCKPSLLQKKLFQAVVTSGGFSSFLNDFQSRDALSMISVFRKICNSPSLVATDPMFKSISQSSDPETLPGSLQNRFSGSKVNVVIPLLIEFHNKSEKVVVVSNFTQTLDLLEKAILKLNLRYVRLDGTTPLNLRDQLVTRFNKNSNLDIFLLSAKAGGVGLNLVGASRLVLFDNDWNPLVDHQAMARIHRDGQKKPVFIYRLFTTGGIDEKIFQRQLMKNTLSDMFIDEKSDSSLNLFDYDDLKDLFSIVDTNCNTHDLLECHCNGLGDVVELENMDDGEEDLTLENVQSQSSGWMSALDYLQIDDKNISKRQTIRSALSKYRHFAPNTSIPMTEDEILNNLLKKLDCITYLFIREG